MRLQLPRQHVFLPAALFVWGLLTCLWSVSADVPRKKFIELGWDIPSTQFMREHFREMEEKAPFSGIIYRIQPNPNDHDGTSEWMFSDKPWNRADYQSCIDDLKACKFQSFTDNFIRMNFSPGTLAWDDDAGWKILAGKAAICAWVAKASGSKGLAPDFESYGNAIFRWNPEKQNGLSFAEAKALARRRGAQFIEAIASEFPDATVLALWLNSINQDAGSSPNPDSILITAGYGLLPAFINGMLSAAPTAMTFVDGCETGYYIENEQFRSYALNMILWTGACMNLVEPELRQKYRSQVQCGFGIYLDMFSNPEGNTYYRGPLENGTRLDRLCQCLEDSLRASDQYVWVYGEKNRWWNVPETQNPEKPCLHWETALPGLSDRMLFIAEPEKMVARTAQKALDGQFGANLFKNPSFGNAKDGKPAEWGFWQHEKSQGKYLAETLEGKSVVSFQNVSNGCALQFLDVTPGQRYFVQVRVRTCGNAAANMTLSWQNEKGWDWQWSKSYAADPKDSSEWKTIRAVTTVPPGISKLGVLLGVSSQAAETDQCSYGDAEIYLIP